MQNFPHIVMLSTADWDNPFWTNKQHVALTLADMGYSIFYIESLGLRAPSLNKTDCVRIFKRLAKGLKSPRAIHKNIIVFSPLVLPRQNNSVIRFLNKVLLSWQLFFWMKWLNITPQWLWTYSPITTFQLDTKKFLMTVYHCVDEIKDQPGMPVQIIEEAERQLLERADIVFTTSHALQESKIKINSACFYYPNVADFSHFNKAITINERPEDIRHLPGKIIGFVGAISNYKVDMCLLLKLSEARPQDSIVLIGKVGEGDPKANINDITGVHNIHIIGARSYQELPNYIASFDVALIPCVINSYTRHMFPMKFFEYLAAGKPVVCTALDSLRTYKDVVYWAPNHEKFIDDVNTALSTKNSAEKLIEIASEHTYQVRTKYMLEKIYAQFAIKKARE